MYVNADAVLASILNRVRAASSSDIRTVVCDLSASPYLDLAGSHMLHELHSEPAARGIALRIVGAHGRVRDLLRADGVGEKVGGLDRVDTLDGFRVIFHPLPPRQVARHSLPASREPAAISCALSRHDNDDLQSAGRCQVTGDWIRKLRLCVLLPSVIARAACEGMGIHDTESLIHPTLSRSDVVGLVAGFGTTVAALPDLLVMLKRRSSAGINPRMAGIMCVFQFAWVYYGLLILSRPVIAWNVIAIMINGLSVGAYLHFMRKERSQAKGR